MTTATLTASPFAAFYATAEPEVETVTVCQIICFHPTNSRAGGPIFVCYRNASPAEQERGFFGPQDVAVFTSSKVPAELREMAYRTRISILTTEHTLAQYRDRVDLDRYDSIRYLPGQYLPLG
jgi:hypothetical protein